MKILTYKLYFELILYGGTFYYVINMCKKPFKNLKVYK